MLITFKVSNFLSFNDEVEFSMMAGQPRQLPSHVIHFGEGRSRVDILKTAVVYGANASGKSNLIKAMDFARKIIVNGLKSENTYNKHFRLDSSNQAKVSKFEFEFKTGDKVYAYGFSLHLESKKFKSEWLSEIGKTTDKPIFERAVLENGKSDFKFYLKLKGKIATRFDVYKEDILDSQLFLTELNEKNLEDIKEVEDFGEAFYWFEHDLIILPSTDFDVLNLSLTSFIHFNQNDLKKYFDLFNTGIFQISTKEIPFEKAEWAIKTFNLSPFIEQLKQNKDVTEDAIFPFVFWFDGEQTRIAFSKTKNNEVKISQIIALTNSKKDGDVVDFEMQDLSDGTRRVLDLIPFLNVAQQDDFTFIIDEIDRSLHPELTRKLIEVFHKTTEGVESQLIVTTHESSLLDLNLLRRDEIWFTEKNQDGESHIYSLEEFKPRHDTELRKAYLQGRFGAIPFISDANLLGWAKNNHQITTSTEKPTPSV